MHDICIPDTRGDCRRMPAQNAEPLRKHPKRRQINFTEGLMATAYATARVHYAVTKPQTSLAHAAISAQHSANILLWLLLLRHRS